MKKFYANQKSNLKSHNPGRWARWAFAEDGANALYLSILENISLPVLRLEGELPCEDCSEC